MPIQLLGPLRRLLPEHSIDHVEDVGWKGKKDDFPLADAARRGYDALITNDSAQLKSPHECRAIRDSGLHHVRYTHDTRRGIDGLALAMAAVMGALRQVARDLDRATGQRLVEIRALRPEKRHTIVDPDVEPPPYWPRKPGPRRRQGR